MDGRDNDEDRFVDCDDLECMGTLSCGRSILFEEGIATRNRYLPAAVDCITDNCVDFPIGGCTLSIEGSGFIRTPTEQQNYESCFFEVSLLYTSENDCTALTLAPESLSLSSDCIEDQTDLIPTLLLSDSFGHPYSFTSDTFRFEGIDEQFVDDHYRWNASLRPFYAR
jgi:hypothetical protein